jgi:hypothetical protein
MRYRHMAAGGVLALLIACSKRADSPARSASDSAGAGTASQAAHMELKAPPMLPVVRAHLDSLSRNPAMMHKEMAQHQAEVKHLVDAMKSDMTAMGMQSDAGYEVLADSVVSGSARLGSAGGAEFKRLVTEHIDQVRRLAAMYESKTGQTSQ